MADDVKININQVSEEGESIAPAENARKFINQCAVIVRDNIPISVKQWKKPKGDDVPEGDYVIDRQKDDLWTALMAYFTLPPEEDPNKPVIDPLVKACDLKKMENIFGKWKNDLKSMFVDKGKIPEFVSRFEKIRDHWPAFVAYKTSDKSKKMSETNKNNAAKKRYHHHTGSGGFLKARRFSDKAENVLIAKRVEPQILNWPDHSRTWFFGVGGILDRETGKCRWTDEKLAIPINKL